MLATVPRLRRKPRLWASVARSAVHCTLQARQGREGVGERARALERGAREEVRDRREAETREKGQFNLIGQFNSKVHF